MLRLLREQEVLGEHGGGQWFFAKRYLGLGFVTIPLVASLGGVAGTAVPNPFRWDMQLFGGGSFGLYSRLSASLWSGVILNSFSVAP